MKSPSWAKNLICSQRILTSADHLTLWHDLSLNSVNPSPYLLRASSSLACLDRCKAPSWVSQTFLPSSVGLLGCNCWGAMWKEPRYPETTGVCLRSLVKTIPRSPLSKTKKENSYTKQTRITKLTETTIAKPQKRLPTKHHKLPRKLLKPQKASITHTFALDSPYLKKKTSSQKPPQNTPNHCPPTENQKKKQGDQKKPTKNPAPSSWNKPPRPNQTKRKQTVKRSNGFGSCKLGLRGASLLGKGIAKLSFSWRHPRGSARPFFGEANRLL